MFCRRIHWLARRAHARSIWRIAGLRCAERGDEFDSASVLSSGQAVVEFSMILPLIFLLIVNAINFGAFFFAWITVANAARTGCQYWALGSAAIGTPTAATAAQVTGVVTSDISSLLNRASLVVRACRNNNGSITCTGAGSGNPPADPEALNYVSASVDVTYTYKPPIPLFSFPGIGVYVTLPPTTIHRQSVMRMLQ